MSALASPAAMAQLYATATDALYTIADQYFHLGRFKEAQSILDTVLHLLAAQEVQPQQQINPLLLKGAILIVEHLLTRSQTEPMFAPLQAAKQLAEVNQDQQALADALSLLGQAHYFTTVVARLQRAVSPDSLQEQGEYADAFAYQQQALAIREDLQDQRGISESFFQIGAIYERWRQQDQAQTYYRKACQIADQSDCRFEKTEPLRHMALYAFRQGNLDQALTCASEALSLRQAAGFKPYLPLDHRLLSDIYQAKGNSAQALFHQQQAATLADEMGFAPLIALVSTRSDRLPTPKVEAQA